MLPNLFAVITVSSITVPSVQGKHICIPKAFTNEH